MLPILIEHELKKLTKGVASTREVLAWPEARLYCVQEDLSLWSPAQQVYHGSLVALRILELVQKIYEDEDPEIVRKGRPTGNGFAVLTFGRIPRGRAQSPSALLPPPEVTRADVEDLLRSVDKKIEITHDRSRYLYDLKGRWPHPSLGVFNAPQWIRFCRIHTEHHLAIAREIGAAFDHKHH